MKHTSLKFRSKVKPLEKINDEFTLCRCYVQGVGKNRNFSYMSKENIERCLPTLSYAPIVGHLIDKLDADGNPTGEKYMGGHDYYITDDWELKSACVPYGVVKDNSFSFEMVKEYEDGIETEYLVADVILWTGRYPELMEAIYSDDFYFNQSMEINVEEYRPYEEDSNYTELTDFTYSALCLLGKADDKNSVEHTEPCFIESKVIPIQYSIEQDTFSKVMGELKEELAFYFNKDTNNVDRKEEDAVENLKDTEVMEVEISESENNEPTKVIAEDAVETPEVNEMELSTEDNEVGDVNDEVEDTAEDNNVSEEKNVDEEVNDEEDKYSLLLKEYEDYKASHSHSDEEYDLLKSYHDNEESLKLHAKREEILANEKYSSISESEAFKNLVENMDNYSLEELEKEAKIIFADNFGMANFAIAESTKKIRKIQFSQKENKTKSKAYSTLFK